MNSAKESLNYSSLVWDKRVFHSFEGVELKTGKLEKYGKVIQSPSDAPEVIGIGNVVYDPEREIVRIYYGAGDGRTVLTAESADGLHFTKPDLGRDPKKNRVVVNAINIQTDRILKSGELSSPTDWPKEDDWDNTDRTKEFLLSYTGDKSPYDSCVQSLFSDEYVFVRIFCPKNRAKNAKPYSIELFIQTDVSNGPFYKFLLDEHGKRSTRWFVDSSNETGKENDYFPEYQENHGDDFWETTFRLKKTDLSSPVDSPGWGINVAFNTYKSNGCPLWTNWALVGGHHWSELFGLLLFSEQSFQEKYPGGIEAVLNAEITTECRKGFSVIYDTNGDACERFKMIWRSDDSLFIASSPDGYTFNTNKQLLNSGSLDAPNVLLWDDLTSKYRIYMRWWFKGDKYPELPLMRRAVSEIHSSAWTEGWSERKVVCDPIDIPNGECWWDIYTPAVFVYENLYMSMPSIFYRNIEKGPLIPSLQCSLDGEEWSWLDDARPFLELTNNDFDAGMIICATPPIRFGDELYFYYHGRSFQHEEPETARLRIHESAIGMAKLRLDGFAYLEAGDSDGTAITEKMIFNSLDGMSVNADIFEDGRIEILVLDDNESVLMKSASVQGNAVNLKVEWLDGFLSEYAEKEVRLKFILKKAKLYSFRRGVV